MNKRMLLVCLMAAATVLLHQRTVDQPDERNFPGPDTPSVTFAGNRGQAPAPATGSTPDVLAVTTGTVRGARLPVAAGHVVAQLGISGPAADARLASIGSRAIHSSRWTGQTRLAVPEGMSPDQFVKFLRDSGLASDAAADPIVEATGFTGPDKTAPLYALQWHHSAARTHELWNSTHVTTYAGGAVVAVLDTGVGHDPRLGHVVAGDLAETHFVHPYNAFDGGSDAGDDHQHGTHIAAVIGAYGNAPGTGYGRDLMPVKVLDADKRGTESTLIDGIHHAIDNGADVINMSLSFPRAYMPSPALSEAIARAQDADVSMVASAGNNGEPWVSYPAAFPGVIAVGAARMQRQPDGKIKYVRAEYSNYGPGLDLMAPGGDVSRDEDRDGWPDGVLAQAFPLQRPTEPPAYYFVSGTSAAAAQVSAVVAAMRDDGASARDARWGIVEDRTKMAENEDGSADFAHQDEYDPRVGTGLLHSKKAFGKADAHHPADYGIALSVVLTDAGNSARRGVAVVEVIDAGGPVKDAQVWVSWLGDASGYGHCVTGDDGMCAVTSDAVDGAMVIGASAAGFRAGEDHQMIRAIPITRIETRALQLLGTLGTGLASSSLILDFSPTALDWFGAWTNDPVLDTMSVHNTGTGLASSSIVLGIDALAFLDSPLAGQFTAFESGGTGLASSSIVLDPEFYNLAAPGALDTRTATVWGYPVGSGLASSSIVIDETQFAFSDFMSPYLDPGVLYFNTGSGLASSSLILDLTMWNQDLFSGTPSVYESFEGIGTGLASSSFIFDYNLGTLDYLGYDTGAWSLDGTGLASSSLILDDSFSTSLTLGELSQWYSFGLSDDTVGAGVGVVRMD